MKLKFLVFYIFCFFCLMAFSSCDGIFPTATKSNLPEDHSTLYGGFRHKTSNGKININDCTSCHSIEQLSGKVTIINGVNTWANSCYQCHGNLWERRGNGE